MLDVKRIISEPEMVNDGLLKRLDQDEFDLEAITLLYEQKQILQKEFEELRTEQNSYNDKMAKVEKGSDEFKEMLPKLKEISAAVKEAEEKVREADLLLVAAVEVLPNIPDEDVVAGEKEANEIVKSFKEKPQFDFKVKDHTQLGEELELFDFTRAAKLGGAQMAMYTGDGAVLEWALINFFIKEHLAAGYKMMLPPHLLTEHSAYVAGQLPKFKDDVYWTTDGACLLPTAETALANLYTGETLDESDLPQKFFAYTPCYRKEAGSYRANERGLMRMHQFNKVEMFQYTTENQSDEALDELVARAESLVEKLDLHYNTVKLAAGDCSAAAVKTFDVEVFLPALDRYIEVSSISNTRDYQTRRGNMRYKPTDGGKPRYMHLLNASGLATSRLMVAVVETYQNADGSITVPDALREFVGKDKLEPNK